MIWQWIVAAIVAIIVTPIAGIALICGTVALDVAWTEFMERHPRVQLACAFVVASLILIMVTGTIFKTMFGGGA